VPVSSELKERIIAHARDRFFREGFAKISVDEIVSDLSMSKKTFYQHFESKDDLVVEMMERKFTEVNAIMDRILSAETDFVHKLQDFVTYIGGMLGTISKAMFADVQRHLPHLWKRIEQFRRDRLTKNNSILVQQGRSEGLIRDDVNPRLFLLAYLATIDGIMQANVLMNESFSSRDALEGIMNIFFKGILTDAGRIQLNELQHSIFLHQAKGLS